MKKVIYFTRTGLLEPLGQSQVMNYMIGLSSKFSITIISNEKKEDLNNLQRVESLKYLCSQNNIKWVQLKFRKRPLVLAQFFSIVDMFWAGIKEFFHGNVRLIHARSYIPAVSAWMIYRLCKVPFIFDMRGLWPEELIVSGRVNRGSFVHKCLKKIEVVLMRDSSAVVSLTDAGAAYLKATNSSELINQKIEVIPTCADLDKFSPLSTKRSKEIVFGCIGSILSGWFNILWFSKFLEVAHSLNKDTRFEIITRDNKSLVREAVDPNNRLLRNLKITERSPEGMPEAIRGHHISVMFYMGGEISELGRSPTRLAEVLGCGLPVIVNDGVGDVANIVKKYNVGVVVKSPALEHMESALKEISCLLQDNNLEMRCRKTAETIFSLESGTNKYRNLYCSIISKEKF